MQVLLSKERPDILAKLDLELLRQPLFAICKYVFPVVPVNVMRFGFRRVSHAQFVGPRQRARLYHLEKI